VSTRATSSSVDADLVAVENELRADGRLAFATCEALRSDPRFRGLESCLRFLHCAVFAADPEHPPIPRRRRVQACRLMLLSLGAHTIAPRWTTLQLEQLVESAMQIPGAELSDLAQAQFALLGETPEVTPKQTAFIAELGQQIAGKKRLGYQSDDFVWMAVRLTDGLPHTRAQKLFAACTLDRSASGNCPGS
jgi:hypothetical protein